MSWVKDIFDPDERRWEEIYRNRFQHDKLVRSTHGVNCTGGCSWNIHVKNGVVALETQATDYPRISCDVPAYEPRGCQRGISTSWYLYSPLRVKYPYLRGVLMDLWREARKVHADPVAAWASIVDDPEKRARYQEARGKGGLRRSSWDEVLELVAASTIHTVKRHGSDRIIGFSPIPAMSMLSFAAGSRFLQLLGGVNLSFYDWYCDLPNASPEVWGEQTDVAESADWYHSKFIVSMGANLGMTRTPDVHFAAEARHDGAKLVVLSPDFSMTSKYADQWIPIHAGQDAAFWLAVDHVILKEFHHERQTPYFLDYVRRYSDAPFLVELEEHEGGLRPGRMLRASELSRTRDTENGDFKFLVWDGTTNAPRMPRGTLGFRWQHEKGQWNLEMKDGVDGQDIDARTTFLGDADAVAQVAFDEYGSGSVALRGVPVRTVETLRGPVKVATVYDLLFAQYGVSRGLPGDWPAGYEDVDAAYTPAWQERFTGVSAAEVIRFAREWATTAEKTGGKCSVIIGAGVNQWYHGDHAYRAAIAGLVLCGCIGKNGGGLNHYVGQEKLAPVAPWSALAFALDWAGPPRLQNAPSFHYVHSDQWRYERSGEDEQLNPLPGPSEFATRHTMDHQARAVRLGLAPLLPAVRPHSHRGGGGREGGRREDRRRGLLLGGEATQGEEAQVLGGGPGRAGELAAALVHLARQRPHVLGEGARVLPAPLPGHPLQHRGAGDGQGRGRGRRLAGTRAEGEARPGRRPQLPDGHDGPLLRRHPPGRHLVREGRPQLHRHALVHPPPAGGGPALLGVEERLGHLQGHRREGERAREGAPARAGAGDRHPPAHARHPRRDGPAGAARLGEGGVRAGARQDHAGPRVRGPGLRQPAPEVRLLRSGGPGPGHRRPRHHLAGGRPLRRAGPRPTDGGVGRARASPPSRTPRTPPTSSCTWPRRPTASRPSAPSPPRRRRSGSRSPTWWPGAGTSGPPSPTWPGSRAGSSTRPAGPASPGTAAPTRPTASTWSGSSPGGPSPGGSTSTSTTRASSPSGRRSPPTSPSPARTSSKDLEASGNGRQSLQLNYLTPHGKWGIHSTFGDNLRMLSLSRGTHPLWVNDKDAATIGLQDNDWVEAWNDHGVVVVRCVVSARIPAGLCLLYHAPERTIGVPKSPERGGKRAGGHNSLTRVRLKPTLMLGGYGQFTFALNYWGPTGNNRDTFIRVRKLVGAPQY